MIGILALEAHRSGGIIIGEDLGVVPDGVFSYLKQRGIFGTSILWFERLSDGKPRPVQKLRSECLASVTTHDIPPTIAYLRGTHVKLRHELGLLTEDYKKMIHEQQVDREKTVNYLIQNEFLTRANSGDEVEIAIALQRSLFSAPSKLIAFSFTDFVGETRAQNQPGTNNEYPNWRVPLQDIDKNLVYNNSIFENQTFVRFANSLSDKFKPGGNSSQNLINKED
jgi:4-alpha-glucanotransferase